jgi:hypothetical protein
MKRCGLNCSSSDSCVQLVSTLNGMHGWLNETLEQIRHQQTLGGDLVSLQLQYEQLEVVHHNGNPDFLVLPG